MEYTLLNKIEQLKQGLPDVKTYEGTEHNVDFDFNGRLYTVAFFIITDRFGNMFWMTDSDKWVRPRSENGKDFID